jgi:hypothetical protein
MLKISIKTGKTLRKPLKTCGKPAFAVDKGREKPQG